MKRFLILLLLAACRKDVPEPGPILGQEFTLAPNSGVRLPTVRPEPYSDEDLTLLFRLTDVQDSRCPLGVYCGSPGTAQTAFELHRQGQTHRDSLCLGICRQPDGSLTYHWADSVTVNLSGQSFRVVLKAIDSERVTGKPPGATFLVK